MGAVAAGAAIIGTGLSVYGQIKSANDQADLEQAKAQLSRQQAKEILDREQINDSNQQEAAIRTKLDFGSAFAATGRQGGLGSQLELQRQVDQQISLNDREAKFQAMMIEKGADLQDQAADNTRSSGYINAASTLLGGIGKAAMPSSGMTPAGSAQSLPSFSGG